MPDKDTTRLLALEQSLAQARNALRLTQAELAQLKEQLEHLNAIKSLFLSLTAHDLRTPLTILAGYAELIRSRSERSRSERSHGEQMQPAQIEEFVQTIHAQLGYLERLVQDLLDLEALESGRFTIELDLCDLAAVLRDAYQVMELYAEQQELRCLFELPAEALMILGDPPRLSQILFNLIGNAIKYSHPGGSIHVHAWAEDGLARISIQDTGIGIRPEELAHLFELYYRTAAAGLKRTRGVGLGMYVAKTLLDAHHATIQVESAPDAGTQFILSFPLAAPGAGIAPGA